MPGKSGEKLHVVAVNQQEAEDLADLIGYDSRAHADLHLKQVQAPPTDEFYAKQYRVFTVARAKAKGERTNEAAGGGVTERAEES